MSQHLAAPPAWGWFIVLYFFFGGIAGGAYTLGTMLRLWGEPRDEDAARLAFVISFLVLLICPVLLTLDLGRPLRFWHMLVDSRTMTFAFKYWSPMSVGAWALAIFGVFATGSFLAARRPDGPIGRLLRGPFGRLFTIVGSGLGLFIAGYTGVLLSVSNEPVWSDTWTLGGLFLASALSASAAAIMLVAIRRQGRGTGSQAAVSVAKLSDADRYFIILELVLLAMFFLTLGAVASQVFAGGWALLWVVVLAGTVGPLVLHLRRSAPLLAPSLVLLGNLALRTVVVFGAQAR
jgi:formate-dependent nitrite reductase membrane component NrfD